MLNLAALELARIQFAFTISSHIIFPAITIGLASYLVVLEGLSPFSVFTGIGLVAAYALLGSTWLILKTEGELQRRMVALARSISLGLLVIIGIVSLWTPLTHADVATRWFTFPNVIFFAPVPILVLATEWLILRMMARETHAAPFLLTLVPLFLGYSGLGISLWPKIIPPAVSIREAAAPGRGGFRLPAADVNGRHDRLGAP